MMTKTCALGAAMMLAMAGTSAHAIVISTGTGDGSVTIDVDGFGRSFSALYDPVGDVAQANTFFDSFTAFQFGNIRVAAADDVEIVETTDTSIVSRFSVGNLAVELTQSVSESFDGDALVGSLFTQSYRITNTASVPNNFDLIRYLDGDLDFDGTIDDGGGITELGGTRVLYETDAAEGSDAAVTFVGITATEGNNDVDGNYQIGEYSDLVDTTLGGGSLDNTVFNDTDGDGFVDIPFDVELAIQEFFTLGVGQSTTFVTNTIFGNAIPPEPGSSEALPLLPDVTQGPDGQNAFLFEIDADDIEEGETFWIDPIIAVGYTYEVTGASFFSVTAPSFATVPDSDGYILTFDDGMGVQMIALAVGATYEFMGSVSSFTLTGIDEALMIDPDNPLGFVTGIAVTAITDSTIIITQTPITINTVGEIPLPAGGLLMATGLGAAFMRRRRKAAA